MTRNEYSTNVKTQHKIENIGIVPEPQRTNIRYFVSLADDIFTRTGMVGSQEQEMFYKSVEGQIILSLMPLKRKEGKYLSLSDFHIGDMPSEYNEIYDVHKVILELWREFYPITKFKEIKYKVKDRVTVAKVVGSESLGYTLVTKEARVIEIGRMNIANPDSAVLDVIIEDDIMPTRVSEGKPHMIFWRLA